MTAVAGGTFHSLALLSNGTVVAAGYGGQGATSFPANLSGVTAIAAGNSHSLAVVADTGAPTVTGAADRAPNAAGWYSDSVTVSWTATDDVEGPLPTPPATVQTSESDGSGQPAQSDPVCDRSGNCSRGSFGPVKLDRTAPQVTLAGVVDGGTYQGAAPAASCNATDALSGLEAPCAVSLSGGMNGIGTLTATATASDQAGNTATAKATFTVTAPNTCTPSKPGRPGHNDRKPGAVPRDRKAQNHKTGGDSRHRGENHHGDSDDHHGTDDACDD